MTVAAESWPPDIFVLVPAYRAVSSLKMFLPELLASVPADQVCVADDGSNDGTGNLCVALHVPYVSHPVNRGKGATLSSGFDYLRANRNPAWIITMDADGQHAVGDLPLFVRAARGNPEVGIIAGRREARPGKMPAARILSNTITSKILSLLAGRHIHDSQCGYRAYSARLLAVIACRFPRFEMESEIILRACNRGFSVDFVNVQTLYFRTHSHISLVADTLRWLRAVFTIFLELRSHRDSIHA